MEHEKSYKVKTDSEIRDTLLEFECQPILFVGSGLSRRYFSGPNWTELLRDIFLKIDGDLNKFNYLSQKHNDSVIEIGNVLVDLAFEWAWGAGRNQFPTELFVAGVSKDSFLKSLIAEHFRGITPTLSSIQDGDLIAEIEALSEIKPHAIITTNYDLFLEQIFQGYAPITGQTILKYNTNSFGEIFHIHGDISDFKSIVVTKNDYDEWEKKKKYISAKLLTYFAEHPVFIIGYNIGDPNVRSILRDIGELVADDSGLIRNVYQIVWHNGAVGRTESDQVVISDGETEFRIKAIHADEFLWIYKALRSQSALTSINPKLVRALAARTMKLVRHDIPSGAVNVNYDVLERVADEKDFLPSLLGITIADNPNQSHPYTLSQLAKRLGFQSWHPVGKIVAEIKTAKGIDLRSSDNKYHCKIKTGSKDTSITRKWSHEAVDLIKKHQAGEDYVLDI